MSPALADDAERNGVHYARNASSQHKIGQVCQTPVFSSIWQIRARSWTSRREYGTYEVKDHDLEQDLQGEVLEIQVQKHRDV